MRLLFSVGYFDHKINANIKIATNLAHALIQQGCQCVLMGEGQSRKSESWQDEAGVFFYATRKVAYYNGTYIGFAWHEIEHFLYAKAVNRKVCEWKCDAVILIGAPYRPIHALLLNYHGAAPLFLYQLDPEALHATVPGPLSKRSIEKEIKGFGVFKGIFTTPILYQQYQTIPDYQTMLFKMFPLEFPMLRDVLPNQSIQSAIDFDSAFCNLLFCGTIHDLYRNPATFLNMSIKIAEEYKLRFYFMGQNDSETLTAYAQKYPQFVFIRPSVSPALAEATAQKADILLSIGNVFENQMPSKLIEYFSTGKPVIGVTKVKNALEIDYLKKYPLALHVDEHAPNVQALKDFLVIIRGKQIGYNEIVKLFPQCTPEIVANEMRTVISKFGENNNAATHI